MLMYCAANENGSSGRQREIMIWSVHPGKRKLMVNAEKHSAIFSLQKLDSLAIQMSSIFWNKNEKIAKLLCVFI